MKSQVSKIYKDYPEHPYISPDRDLKLWEEKPEEFHYGIIEKNKMIRLEEGILPGHVIMLWRIHFGTFTNKTVIPAYFEFRYGVNSYECIETLLKLKYITIASAINSLNLLTAKKLKEILSSENLELKGKKDELIKRIKDNISENKLESKFDLRKYEITKSGQAIVDKYDSTIIEKHGKKM